MIRGARMIRFGLCCKFLVEPIRFREATATALLRLSRRERLARLSELCVWNAGSLLKALEFCAGRGIGDFRINSQILPLKTHPDAGYGIGELPDAAAIEAGFRGCGAYAAEQGLRLTFHPDQFILLSSEDRGVTRRSVAELEYQAEVAGWVGADVINLHAGGVYGDRVSALKRVARRIDGLPEAVRKRLTLENDERCYSPAELLPFCRAVGVPMVYDVHHHRCREDGMSEDEAARQALATWDREPLFHVSSPLGGRKPFDTRHADYIQIRDFPAAWLRLGVRLTVEVEAKAKERAVLRLMRAVAGR